MVSARRGAVRVCSCFWRNNSGVGAGDMYVGIVLVLKKWWSAVFVCSRRWVGKWALGRREG